MSILKINHLWSQLVKASQCSHHAPCFLSLAFETRAEAALCVARRALGSHSSQRATRSLAPSCGGGRGKARLGLYGADAAIFHPSEKTPTLLGQAVVRYSVLCHPLASPRLVFSCGLVVYPRHCSGVPPACAAACSVGWLRSSWPAGTFRGLMAFFTQVSPGWEAKPGVSLDTPEIPVFWQQSISGNLVSSSLVA